MTEPSVSSETRTTTSDMPRRGILAGATLSDPMTHKILSVDDSKVVRIMITRALNPYDCRVVEAANGVDGLEAAAREKPDLIFLDITMPVMDGLEMLTRLKSNPELRSIPVVMLTAESNQDSIRRADGLGIVGYIAKPFKESQLVEKAKLAVALEPKVAL